MKKQKIALFHPWIKSKGGAEKVVLELLKKSKNNFDIYTWAYDKENTFPEFQNYKINILVPNFGRKLARFHILRGLFFPLSLFKKIPLEKYDKFLISTSGLAEFITFRNYKKGKTYAYVHTPLREANKKIVKWNLENRHKNSFFQKQIYLAAVKFYKIFEKRAWKKLDVVIFNSELSQSRAEEHGLLKKQKKQIIYPPVDFSRFEGLKTTTGSSFVYISRLNSPKRQDLLIKAWKIFSKHNKKYNLILIGTPDNKKYYKKLLDLSKGDKTIQIKLNPSNEEFDKILSAAKAGIFLGYQEDFGIVPLEIIAAGKPLLAVDEGGYVKLVAGHPLFHKIKEKHSKEKMIKEISKELENFVKNKQRKITKKVKLKDFITQMDEVLGE
jgi:glycosyltransferase involved in cell wall biosynthesis